MKFSDFPCVGFGLLVLAGCAADPGNDPRSGGFLGGVRGLSSGDYDIRQRQLREERDDSLSELRALRQEGASLDAERAMKADEIVAQRRQLASLEARNREMARRIEQLRRSKAATEQRTAALRRQQRQLARDIRQFETELDRGQLSAPQADAKRLSLERQYDAIEKL